MADGRTLRYDSVVVRRRRRRRRRTTVIGGIAKCPDERRVTHNKTNAIFIDIGEREGGGGEKMENWQKRKKRV